MRAGHPQIAADLRADHPDRAAAAESLVDLHVAADVAAVGDQGAGRIVVLGLAASRRSDAGLQYRVPQPQVTGNVRAGQEEQPGDGERRPGERVNVAAETAADLDSVGVQCIPAAVAQGRAGESNVAADLRTGNADLAGHLQPKSKQRAGNRQAVCVDGPVARITQLAVVEQQGSAEPGVGEVDDAADAGAAAQHGVVAGVEVPRVDAGEPATPEH